MMIFHEIKFEWDIRQPSAEYSETQIESLDVVHLPFSLFSRWSWSQSYHVTKMFYFQFYLNDWGLT